MNVIEVDHVTKQFGDLKAVDDVSFSVKKGEVFALLGPNGAGKTTTIKMLTTLLRPTDGKIAVNGFDVAMEQDKVRHSFGIVFQDPSLDDELTAWENLEFHGVLYGVPKALRRQRIDELLKMVELNDRRNDLVKNFSGGMKRRLEIARGLVHHPAVLFLDEPTIGLDPQTRNHIWSSIANLNRNEGMTVFFTTHYMEEAARMANLIVVIDHGKVIAQGSPDELKQQTSAESLEEAFLKLTGHGIREESVDAADRFRAHHRLRH